MLFCGFDGGKAMAGQITGPSALNKAGLQAAPRLQAPAHCSLLHSGRIGPPHTALRLGEVVAFSERNWPTLWIHGDLLMC